MERTSETSVRNSQAMASTSTFNSGEAIAKAGIQVSTHLKQHMLMHLLRILYRGLCSEIGVLRVRGKLKLFNDVHR